MLVLAFLTCSYIVAGLVHFAYEELQPNDGINDDDEHDQQTDVEQRHHGLHDGVQHNLQTCMSEIIHIYVRIRPSQNCVYKSLLKSTEESTHLLGTPETRRNGRSTLKALRALTSRPPGLPAA